MIESLHSNLGDKSETPSSKKKKKKNWIVWLNSGHGMQGSVLLFCCLFCFPPHIGITSGAKMAAAFQASHPDSDPEKLRIPTWVSLCRNEKPHPAAETSPSSVSSGLIHQRCPPLNQSLAKRIGPPGWLDQSRPALWAWGEARMKAQDRMEV